MKLALLVPGGVHRSGTDRVIPALLWLIERLARRHEVHVFALQQEEAPSRWELLGARVHHVGGGRWGRRWRMLSWFAAEHERAPFDLVHAFWGGLGTYATLLAWRHRLPVLLHLAGGELVALPEVGYGNLCTLRSRIAIHVALAGASRLTAASAPMLELARSRGVTAERVPLGVALDRWPAAAPRTRDPSLPARLLHIGDLRPVKDQRTLLTAFARLVAAGVDAHLDLAGFDTMSGAMQRLSRELGVESRTSWHGTLPRAALRAQVDRADLLLVTSRHEAGPLVVLEAAVAGVPTVGTSVGHVAEWAPSAAVAVAAGDAAALADATAALLADEPRRLAIAHEAQRRAIVDDADSTAERFERLYHEITLAP